jgi:uncharacterized membrane protein YqiK
VAEARRERGVAEARRERGVAEARRERGMAEARRERRVARNGSMAFRNDAWETRGSMPRRGT